MSSYLSHRRKAFAGAFAPTDITGCDLWLDASDNSTVLDATDAEASDDEAVKTWQDKSGNANHAVQSTVAKQPLRRAAEVNGLDSIDFIGDYLVGTSDLTPRQTDEKTVFIVASADAAGTNTFLTLYDIVGATSGSTGSMTAEVAYRIFDGAWVSSTPASTTNASMITLTQASTGDLLAAVNMWLDGSSVTRTGGADRAFADRSCVYVLGNPESDGTGVSYDGDLCEIIVYDTELSTADRESVETYLADKWGITI
jgi:hypothetical protein